MMLKLLYSIALFSYFLNAFSDSCSNYCRKGTIKLYSSYGASDKNPCVSTSLATFEGCIKGYCSRSNQVSIAMFASYCKTLGYQIGSIDVSKISNMPASTIAMLATSGDFNFVNSGNGNSNSGSSNNESGNSGSNNDAHGNSGNGDRGSSNNRSGNSGSNNDTHDNSGNSNSGSSNDVHGNSPNMTTNSTTNATNNTTANTPATTTPPNFVNFTITPPSNTTNTTNATAKSSSLKSTNLDILCYFVASLVLLVL